MADVNITNHYIKCRKYSKHKAENEGQDKMQDTTKRFQGQLEIQRHREAEIKRERKHVTCNSNPKTAGVTV